LRDGSSLGWLLAHCRSFVQNSALGFVQKPALFEVQQHVELALVGDDPGALLSPGPDLAALELPVGLKLDDGPAAQLLRGVDVLLGLRGRVLRAAHRIERDVLRLGITQHLHQEPGGPDLVDLAELAPVAPLPGDLLPGLEVLALRIPSDGLVGGAVGAVPYPGRGAPPDGRGSIERGTEPRAP
jgi:hypothetical protein